jgi:hypothetical protein
MILPVMHYEWFFLTKTIYDPEVFWAMVTAVATILLVAGTFILAVTSYLPLVRARRAELTERFRSELLTPAAQKIFFLASHGLLEFVVDRKDGRDRMAYFGIKGVEPTIFKQRLDQIVGEQQIVITFEVDDRILNPLQEVAHYEKRGEIEFKDVFRIFADYIDVCFKSPAITAYVQWMRKRVGFKVWDELESLHDRIEIHAGRKPAKANSGSSEGF